MSGTRSTWIAARARNAARQGGWIAGVGAVAVIMTLLALVWVPRELDRQLEARMASLPAMPDTLRIVQRLDSLRRAHRDSLRTDSLVAVAASRPLIAPDSATIELMSRLTRARTAPLPDAYRALASSSLLQQEPRVAALLDSIDKVDREREAHAALGGPGAQYAALTAQLTAFGQQIVRIAEAQVATRVFTSVTSLPTDTLTGSTTPDTLVDSTSVRARALRTARIASEESLLVNARRESIELQTTRAELAKRLNVALPPFAMLIAAMIVGVACGYSVVLLRELRRPTVGDLQEVERLTGAPVLMHTRAVTPSSLVPIERRSRPGVPRVIDRDSDAFVLLHLALTSVGDVVSRADVVADDPVIAAAVALGIGAAAARESRIALVIETTNHAPVLGHLLHTGTRQTLDDIRTGGASAEDALHVVMLDRDAHVDVLLAGSISSRPRSRATRSEAPAIAGARRRDRSDSEPPVSIVEEVRRLESRYDIRLHLVDSTDANEWPPARDLIVCARQGATPLAWLSHTMRRAADQQQRVRAVLVWSRTMPTA